jgi:hypothetical protein
MRLKYKETKREKYNRHIIQIPPINEDLLELVGALNGDGHISRKKYDISITGGISSDEKYLYYLSKKISSLFGLKFKMSQHADFIRIRGYSKELSNFLVDKFNVPTGKKKGHLRIPSIATLSPTLFLAYIRGLFDTDGTFYIRRGKDPVIEISSADKDYLNSVQKQLIGLGFSFGRGFNKIRLYDKSSINRFFCIVKPNNPKHLNKYKRYLEKMRR